MYADGEQRKPDLQESYAGAVSTGNSRVEPHKMTRADLISSAGMSIHSTGTALMRLVSEWNSGAIPKERALPDSKILARELAAHRAKQAMADGDKLRDEAGELRLRVGQKAARLASSVPTKADIDLARAELVQREAQSTDWNLQEAKLRFQRLKTLPTIRAGLLYWVRDRWPAESAEEWRDAEYLVAKVLQYFLSPYCPACGGSGVREFAGNNKRGAGKPCPKCRDYAVRGQLNVPCHGKGRALLAHIRACTGRAAKDISEGAYRLRRSGQSEHDRSQHKVNAKTAELRRADAEAHTDSLQDKEAVADRFRRGLELGRKAESN